MEDKQADSYPGIDENLVRLRGIADQSYGKGSMIGKMDWRRTLHTDQPSLALYVRSRYFHDDAMLYY